MQEFKYFMDGATVVISLDGFDWLSGRRCKDKRVKKRDEKLQVLMSSGPVIQPEKELQPITCLCVLDGRGSASPHLWSNTDPSLSFKTWPPTFAIPPGHHRCLQESPKEATWTRPALNMQDIFSFFKTYVHAVTGQDCVTLDQHNRFIIFCDEDIPLQRFGDVCCGEDSKRTSGGHSEVLRNSNANNSTEIQHELVLRDTFYTSSPKSLLKSSQISNAAGVVSRKNRKLQKRRSVSFDDDVMVYLFNQESPTAQLHRGPCTSLPCSSSIDLPDVTLEDSGLEWEDDFSALEKNRHFQCVGPSYGGPPSPRRGRSPPSRPDRFTLSQSCLFLTHVSDSDLEP